MTGRDWADDRAASLAARYRGTTYDGWRMAIAHEIRAARAEGRREGTEEVEALKDKLRRARLAAHWWKRAAKRYWRIIDGACRDMYAAGLAEEADALATGGKG